jgi:hypothetical protein
MMIKYNKQEMKDLYREQLKAYKAEIGPMTPEERKELNKWVATGNNPYDNPYLLYRDDGHPMDFIDATRTAEDMWRNPEEYRWSGSGKTFAECMRLIDAGIDVFEMGISLDEEAPF